MRLLDPLFMMINGISKVLNAIHKAMWDLFTGPINWVSEGLSKGINFLIDGINNALGLLKNLGVDVQIPNIELPTFGEAAQIPMIPMADARQGVAMAGGGLVPGEKKDVDPNGKKDFDKSHYGTEMRISRGREDIWVVVLGAGMRISSGVRIFGWQF